jgi:cell wall-associated NlpC family hydrolase
LLQLARLLDRIAMRTPCSGGFSPWTSDPDTTRVKVRIITAQTFVAVVVSALALVLVLAPGAFAGTVTTTPQVRAAAADAAVAKLGSPYRRGSMGPKRFDCSGLVDFAYRAAGFPLAGRSSFDLWTLGAHVRRAALRRGDLVYTWDRSHGHVGIYLGNGRYVHAPGTGRRVEIAPLPRGRDFVGAVRP